MRNSCYYPSSFRMRRKTTNNPKRLPEMRLPLPEMRFLFPGTSLPYPGAELPFPGTELPFPGTRGWLPGIDPKHKFGKQ